MPEYIPSTWDWVAEQVELYERTNGAEGNTLRDTGRPVIIMTNIGHKTGAIRKTPLMRIVDGDRYIFVAAKGGAPEHPFWYHNIKANPDVEIRDKSEVFPMRVIEVEESPERQRLWAIAISTYPPIATYQEKTDRTIPLFVAELRD